MLPQDLKQRWQLHAVEPLPNTSERGPDKEDPIKFKCADHHLKCRATLQRHWNLLSSVMSVTSDEHD